MDTPSGTRARFKQWQQLADEFGLTRTGHISCPMVFTVDMRPLCGRVVTVKLMHGPFGGVLIEKWTPPHDLAALLDTSHVSREMLELAPPLHKQIAHMLRTRRAAIYATYMEALSS